jgi:hypothetical protein
MKLLLLLRKEMLLFIDLEPQNDKVWSLAFTKVLNLILTFPYHLILLYSNFYNSIYRLKT